MLKQQDRGTDGSGRARFKNDPMVDAQEERRFQLILVNGLSVAASYSSMNRDRYYIHLQDGVTAAKLLEFCREELGGSPIPDRITENHVLLSVFRNAEKAGLVTVEFVKAGQFMPELRKFD